MAYKCIYQLPLPTYLSLSTKLCFRKGSDYILFELSMSIISLEVVIDESRYKKYFKRYLNWYTLYKDFAILSTTWYWFFLIMREDFFENFRTTSNLETLICNSQLEPIYEPLNQWTVSFGSPIGSSRASKCAKPPSRTSSWSLIGDLNSGGEVASIGSGWPLWDNCCW